MPVRKLTATVVLLASALAACEGGIEIGEAPSTTITPSTTTTAPPAPSITAKPTPKPKPKAPAKAAPRTSIPPAALDEAAIEFDPRLLEQFLWEPPQAWSREFDDQAGTGPMDREAVADDDVDEEGERIEDTRRFLESVGFLGGYSREWEKNYAMEPRPRVNHATFAQVNLYAFESAKGAADYMKRDIEAFLRVTGEEMESITVGDVPGSRGWTGGNDDDGYTGVVLFASDVAYVRIVARSTTSANLDYRRAAEEFARGQYARVVA